jgi:hypothetical protein
VKVQRRLGKKGRALNDGDIGVLKPKMTGPSPPDDSEGDEGLS